MNDDAYITHSEYRRLYKAMLKELKNHDEACDITQRACEKLIRHLRKGNPVKAKVSTLLDRTARNLIRTEYLARVRRKKREETHLEMFSQNRSLTPDEAYEADQLLSEIDNELSCRNEANLYFIHNYSMEQYAAKRGIKASTAGSYVTKAKNQLLRGRKKQSEGDV